VASSKSQDLLVSVAESIGSTLGAIAAKADAAQKAISSGTDTAVKEVKRGTDKLVRKSKTTAAKARRSKPARKARSSARSARVIHEAAVHQELRAGHRFLPLKDPLVSGSRRSPCR